VAAGWQAWLRARKEAVLLGAIAAAGLAALALAFAGHAPNWAPWRWESKSDRALPERIAAPPERPMLSAASEETGLSPLSPQMLGEASRFRRVITVEPPYDMVDSRRFYAGDQLIVLTGITAPPMDAVCENEDRTLSPCGIFARATLYAVIRGEKLTCQSQGTAPELSPPAGALVGTCRMQAKDVATELVRVGFARPQGFAPRAMLEAAAEASADKRGLWRNDWKFATRR
jgi:endonuclease YncB( thermonuclease family)